MAFKKRNKFACADDIYLTDKNIAVTRVKSVKDKNGYWRTSQKTIYVPKTVRNLNEAKKIHGFIRKGK